MFSVLGAELSPQSRAGEIQATYTAERLAVTL